MTRLDPILLCCLLHTESRFRKDAVSKRGYKGEAQTLRFSQYSSVNILEGAETLRDKLALSKGDMLEALARDKGGKDKRQAQEEAKEVLRLYRSQVERRGPGNLASTFSPMGADVFRGPTEVPPVDPPFARATHTRSPQYHQS